MKITRKKIASLLVLSLISLFCYGIGRLYFRLTGGFTIPHITSDFAFQPQWEVRPLLAGEEAELAHAISQPYYYLGKGCQSYVFVSQDEKYVIKFFKYQRYRLQFWLEYFPPLPAIAKYRQEKLEKKWNKLNRFVQSWKVAFEHLKEETSLLFVHLNKTADLQQKLVIYDKIGQKHIIDLDQMEFCIQRRMEMLCDTLLNYKINKDLAGAKQLVHQLLNLILSEYARGLADNDHALMQNTGVVDEKPVHIDVGQFVINEAIKDPAVFYQELFTKTYKFKLWLRENYAELADYLEEELSQIIGSAYPAMQPKFRQK